VYYVGGDYANAVTHLKKFLELDPKHAEADQDRELVAYLEKTLKK
jgi:Flp pilus assembly protein TadD